MLLHCSFNEIFGEGSPQGLNSQPFGGRSERLKKRLKGLEVINQPENCLMVQEIRLTNQLSPGVNLPIFSYIFHVEQGFGA